MGSEAVALRPKWCVEVVPEVAPAMATQEGAEGSGEGPSDLGRPLDRSEEDARDAAVLRDALRDPALVAYLEQQMQSELLRRGDEDEIARRMLAEQWRDEQFVDYLSDKVEYAVTEGQCVERGWPWRAFLQCECAPRCIASLARGDPEAISRLATRLREAEERSAAVGPRPRFVRSTWQKDFGGGAEGSVNMTAALAEVAALQLAHEAALGETLDAARLAVNAALLGHSCCLEARAGFLGVSESYLKYAPKKAGAEVRSSTERTSKRLPAALALELPCCKRGCTTALAPAAPGGARPLRLGLLSKPRLAGGGGLSVCSRVALSPAEPTMGLQPQPSVRPSLLHFFNVGRNVRKQHLSLGKWAVSGGHARPADRDQDPRHRRLCLLVRTRPSGGGGARQERRHIHA